MNWKKHICTAAVAASLPLHSLAHAAEAKPNIVVIFGDDIGISNISAYTHGLMGYRTPNIDRIAKDRMVRGSRGLGRFSPRRF